MKALTLVLAAPLLLACVDGAPEAAVTDGALVYGTDNRLEPFQVTDPLQLRLAQATAVVVAPSQLTPVAGGYTLDTRTTLAEEYNTCPDERYGDQPVPGYCTGFKVGNDLIATAGHCVTSADCGATRFVFGFVMTDATTVDAAIATEDVYRCVQVVARAATDTNDWALVRVDRAITGRTALEIRRTGGVTVATALVVAGHPAGLPLKLAAGATVKSSTHADYFEANLDVYGGSSGSPVMNATTGVVEGVLVRGNPDFDYFRGERCYRSNVCPDSGCPGWEDVTRSVKLAPHVSPSGECTSCNEPPPQQCGAPKASCSSNSQCCSGQCKKSSCR